MNKHRNIVVGMSGGADSCVAAALLVEQGYQVTGVTLKTWDSPDKVAHPWRDRSCCKVGIAQYVAERLKIPHHVVDVREMFRQQVVENFLEEYAAGRTPNPCVRCNEKVKFGALLKAARDLGADTLATGHYTRVHYRSGLGRYILRKGVDRDKDQSYFLYRLNQEQLSRTLFPLGEMLKSQIWERVEDLGLPADEMAESQEICFVTQDNRLQFMEQEMPQSVRAGAIVDGDHQELGRHQGVAFYTIGQRRKLGLSAHSSQQPLYVTALDAENNRIQVGPESELYHARLTVRQLNLIQARNLEEWDQLKVTARIRYRAAEVGARLRVLGEDHLEVLFDAPQRAAAPGQSVVMYQGDSVLGGGIIESVFRPVS